MSNQTQVMPQTTKTGTDDSSAKKLRGVATTTSTPALDIEQKYLLWLNSLKIKVAQKEIDVEADDEIVARIELEYPGAFAPGVFCFHGARVFPSKTRALKEAEMNLSQEEKMHGSK